MSRDLRLQIVLGAVDKATSVLKKITQGNKALGDALKATREQKTKLDTQLSNLKSYTDLQEKLRLNESSLESTTAALKKNSDALSTQREGHANIKANLKVARDNYKKLTDAMIDGTGKGEAFTFQLEKARIALQSNQQIFDRSESSIRKHRDTVRKGEDALKKLTDTTKKQREQLTPLTQKLNDAGIKLDDTAKSALELKTRQDALTTSINKQKDALAKMNTQMEKQKRLQENIKKLHGAGMKVAMHGAGAAYLGQAAGRKALSTLTPGVDFEYNLRDMAITGGLSRKEESSLGDQIRIDAEKYGQFTDQISTGLSVLVANGITNAKDLSYYSAVLAKSSVATNSDMEDLGNLIISLRKNLNVAVGDIPASLDSLAYAGKEGSFEIKDMAKWLPQLSPMMAALGVEGRNAVSELGAALQIARLGAGDSDSAANNLKNYLSKITAPETIMHFDKAGIDLQKRLLELSAKGISPVQGSLEVISEYMKTKGLGALKEFNAAMNLENDAEREAAMARLSEAYALGDLFRDMQAMSFIRPAIANSQKMQSIKAGADTASGMIDADWQARMETSRKQLDKLQISLDEIKLEAASIALPAINKILPDVIAFVRKIGEWIKANPDLAKSIAKWTGAIMLALTLLGTLGFVIGNIMVICSGFAAVAAIVGAPFLIVIGAIAAAAFLIWKNWDWLKAEFTQWLSDFNTAWEGGWSSFIPFVGKTLLSIGNLLLDWSPIGLFHQHLFQPLMKMFGIDLPEKFSEFGMLMVESLVKQFASLPKRILQFLPNGPLLKLGAEMMGLMGDDNNEPQTKPKPGIRVNNHQPLIMRPAPAATPASDNISITINAATGNEQSLALQIQRMLEERDRKKAQRRRAVLFDND